MATQKTSTDTNSPAAQASATPCQRLQNQVKAKESQLDNWQNKLEFLLGDVDSDLDEIRTIRDVVTDLNKDLARLKAEQRQLGCVPEEKAVFSNDNQTVISTSSVRRKDRFALAISPKNNSVG